jgi:hypothetical protein
MGGRALVLRGEAGIGTTGLLEHLTGDASGFRVAWAAGVGSEMELAHAARHQLCAPFAKRIDCLPCPQRDALSTAFGRRGGDAPTIQSHRRRPRRRKPAFSGYPNVNEYAAAPVRGR